MMMHGLANVKFFALITFGCLALSISSCSGTEVNHKWMAWRVLLLFALVQTVIVNTYYGASLVSSLVAPAQKNIRTVQDIINSNLKVGYVNVSYNRNFFKV
jgi:hypothetical protein